MKYIAVLLTVHNRKQKTLQCLSLLFKQSLPVGYTIAVFLTDDGCTDGTADAIIAQYPQVTIIKGNGQLYWNRGMLAAWQSASATRCFDYYLWLNDDTYLFDGAICQLVDMAVRYSNQAIVVGATRSSADNHPTYGGRLSDGSLPIPNGKEVRCTTFDGNVVLVPDYVFTQIGYLDSYYTHSGGDTDYGLRATRLSIPIVQSGSFLAICELHATLSTWCNPKCSFVQRMRALYHPTGQPPHELFHLESKFYGIPTAVFHFITTHIHCLIPQLWLWLGKESL